MTNTTVLLPLVLSSTSYVLYIQHCPGTYVTVGEREGQGEIYVMHYYMWCIVVMFLVQHSDLHTCVATEGFSALEMHLLLLIKYY